MNNELTNNTPTIDYETIIKSNNLIEQGVSQAKGILDKIIKIKELCSKKNLYVQGMSMENLLEEYYTEVKLLVNHLDELHNQVKKATYKSQANKSTKLPHNGGDNS